MKKKTKFFLKVILAAFLVLMSLLLLLKVYFAFFTWPKTYVDQTSAMTEEETIKHMTPEEAEKFIKWREEIKKHNLEKNRASDKTKGE